jgi:hypothetical protein
MTNTDQANTLLDGHPGKSSEKDMRELSARWLPLKSENSHPGPRSCEGNDQEVGTLCLLRRRTPGTKSKREENGVFPPKAAWTAHPTCASSFGPVTAALEQNAWRWKGP